ncbi:small integral membrane protein 13-like [Plakobranchus ocellatus]|uniref:Small integral membrane protein 13-like n=1 Tax=Plakobranchus ocellatus TaxID=259542 RepID=A0AAV4BMT7_9GAST|nr:small integral membrane protein 13-like [Plakobranchus ocellatus]
MSWEDAARETLTVLFSVVFTLILIVLAWLVMWRLFFSKIRFVREIISPDSDGKKNDISKKEELRNRREKKRRRDS